MTNTLSPEFRAVKARSILEDTIKLMAADAEKIIQQHTPTFKLEIVKCDWSPTRTAHRGGLYRKMPGINMAMYRLFGIATWVLNPALEQNEPFKVYEYASFDHDPVIGGFYTTNIYDRARCYVCHEVAHAEQFWSKLNNPKTYDRPHGLSFQQPYSILRKTLVNPGLPNQSIMLKQYKEHVTKVIANARKI